MGPRSSVGQKFGDATAPGDGAMTVDTGEPHADVDSREQPGCPDDDREAAGVRLFLGDLVAELVLHHLAGGVAGELGNEPQFAGALVVGEAFGAEREQLGVVE